MIIKSDRIKIPMWFLWDLISLFEWIPLMRYHMEIAVWLGPAIREYDCRSITGFDWWLFPAILSIYLHLRLCCDIQIWYNSGNIPSPHLIFAVFKNNSSVFYLYWHTIPFLTYFDSQKAISYPLSIGTIEAFKLITGFCCQEAQ